MSIKEEGGAGEIGTEKLLRKYIKMTPGQTLEIIKKLIAEKKHRMRPHNRSRKFVGKEDEVQGKFDPDRAYESGQDRADKNLKKAVSKG